jgi:hypothetical protein
MFMDGNFQISKSEVSLKARKDRSIRRSLCAKCFLRPGRCFDESIPPFPCALFGRSVPKSWLRRLYICESLETGSSNAGLM